MIENNTNGLASSSDLFNSTSPNNEYSTAPVDSFTSNMIDHLTIIPTIKIFNPWKSDLQLKRKKKLYRFEHFIQRQFP
ncbi:MAG: hypothetical protein K9W44_14860 [Candidatus Lokiarchaeota archaeon]|nr:hypothetical protein [Candidatus Harpocratesius repetitus]